MVGVARDAAEQIVDILKKIQEKVVQAQNPDADTAKLDADITALARRSPRSPTRRSSTASTSSALPVPTRTSPFRSSARRRALA